MSYSVTLNGPGPWGFRLQGGKDFNMPLTISRITPGSKAAQSQMNQGDMVVAIDGANTDSMTHLEAQNKIKSASYNLSLTLQKSKRPIPVPTTSPRIDSPMPVIPHQKVIANTVANTEYVERFNPNVLKDSALSTHKPIEVKGPGGKATIIHAQYNTPISMYSQDAIMDAIAGQAQAQGGELAGGKKNVAETPENRPAGTAREPQYVTSSVWHHPNTDANTDKAKAMASKGSVRFGTGTSQREASYISSSQTVPLASSSNQSTPVEHAPVSTSCAPSAMPPASAHQPATAAHSAVHQMTLPSAAAISVVHDSISSSCQRGPGQTYTSAPAFHGPAPYTGYSEAPAPPPKPRVVTTASIRPSVYQPGKETSIG
ncbi:LIM domain-binding protein 3 isoform X2 [Elgaria multicarinata webbii]|uniref:LIM domain-binding protein 3 isoform X2 n=1 Tax=Elgaria multicarinata webbii TaxID=159646 RepID=UPI002FCD3A8E